MQTPELTMSPVMIIKSTLLNKLHAFRQAAPAPQAQAPLDQVLLRFERRYGTLRWLRSSTASRRLFLRKLSDALRHRSADRFALAAKVVEQAVNGGVEQVLGGVTKESKSLLLRAHQVSLERRVAESKTRLFPKGESSLIGYAELEHRVGDLVAYGLARRNPGKRVILATQDSCYQAQRGELITITDPNICRTLRHEALNAGAYELYWQSSLSTSRNKS